mmetsp:Transcript_815/g.1930  ORF Transcript_815/g.1930 Transcript_815/m.1930 type:complete len:228 (-) Transcript_815:3641-4324(-)
MRRRQLLCVTTSRMICRSPLPPWPHLPPRNTDGTRSSVRSRRQRPLAPRPRTSSYRRRHRGRRGLLLPLTAEEKIARPSVPSRPRPPASRPPTLCRVRHRRRRPREPRPVPPKGRSGRRRGGRSRRRSIPPSRPAHRPPRGPARRPRPCPRSDRPRRPPNTANRPCTIRYACCWTRTDAVLPRARGTQMSDDVRSSTTTTAGGSSAQLPPPGRRNGPASSRSARLTS